MIDLPSVAKASRAPDQVIQVIIGKDETLDVKIDKNTSRLPLDALVAAVTQAQAGRPAEARAAYALALARQPGRARCLAAMARVGQTVGQR